MTFESFIEAQSFFLWATFGIVLVMGTLVNKTNFCTMGAVSDMVNLGDFMSHFIGAILMGFGGVLAMGCTIGQGITGTSTLAVGAFVTLGAIILGSTLTMKVQYYKMVYEDEASFVSALVAGLADFHLLPNGLRKLEKV